MGLAPVPVSAYGHAVVLALALLSGATSVLGVAAALAAHRSVGTLVVGLGFSAGIMLAIAVLSLTPAAILAQGPLLTALGIGAGGVLMAALHVAIPHTHLFKEAGLAGSTALRAGYLVAFGLVLHDVPEGFAIATSYASAPDRGLLVAAAAALHNVPEEFAMAAPVVLVRRPRLLVAAALASALAEPAGAVLGLVATDLAPRVGPFLLAFAAGAMVFVSVHELVPLARQYGRPRLLVAGMILSVVTYVALAAAILG